MGETATQEVQRPGSKQTLEQYMLTPIDKLGLLAIKHLLDDHDHFTVTFLDSDELRKYDLVPSLDNSEHIQILDTANNRKYEYMRKLGEKVFYRLESAQA